MKIGFFGGSFDPIHFGHLIAAQDALEQLLLDRLIFVPAAQAALKPNSAQCSSADRLALVRAAIAHDTRFEVSDYELTRGGVSYTIESVRHFKKQFPEDDLYWIIGADQLARLHLWREIGALVTLVQFIVLERPGYPLVTHEPIAGLRLHRCKGHLVEISSTEIRARIRENRPLDYFVPHKTIEHIQQKRLYR